MAEIETVTDSIQMIKTSLPQFHVQKSGRGFCILPVKDGICIYRYLLYFPSGKGFSRPSTLGHNPLSSMINPINIPMWE